MSRKYGSPSYSSTGEITALAGCELKVIHLPDQKGEFGDYWQAFVNGVQDDGVTRNEAIMNAFNRSQKSY